jgi:drug/metabolite transporter (DMT)-like permease
MPFDTGVPPRLERRELWIGLGCAVLVLMTWTGYVLLTRLATRATFNPPDLLALRTGIPGLLMLPWFVRNGLGGLRLWQALVLAMTAAIGFGALSFWALSLAPAAHGAALMTGALPLYTSILAMIVLGERFSAVKWTGLVLIVAGVVLMGIESLAAGEPGQWRGDLLFSAASFTWAVYSVLAQRWRVRPLQAATVVYVVSAVLYVPVYVALFDSRLVTAPLDELLVQVLLQGVLVTIVSIFAFMRVVQALGASSTTMLTAAAPGVMTLLAIPLLGEVPSWLAVAGIGFVTAGIGATILALRARSI